MLLTVTQGIMMTTVDHVVVVVSASPLQRNRQSFGKRCLLTGHYQAAATGKAAAGHLREWTR